MNHILSVRRERVAHPQVNVSNRSDLPDELDDAVLLENDIDDARSILFDNALTLFVGCTVFTVAGFNLLQARWYGRQRRVSPSGGRCQQESQHESLHSFPPNGAFELARNAAGMIASRSGIAWCHDHDE